MAKRTEKPNIPLRKGWTTGACATAATKAALLTLFTGKSKPTVTIKLPKGEEPVFQIFDRESGGGFAQVSIIKDAGDDPDVTHKAEIIVRVERSNPSSGISFFAGEGVGIVTLPGLPVLVGEPAINPAPRKMMKEIVNQICEQHNEKCDMKITISVKNGEEIAKQTWNPRIGIKGGLSILGTTGIVHPFSCSAWISSIHRGIDVCRANNHNHILAATGSTSQVAAMKLHKFPDPAIIDMGDFIGGVLKYLRANPVPKITIAGGFAKLSKFANGAMDLHSGRSQVDFSWLAEQATNAGLNQNFKSSIQNANTAMHVLELIHETEIDLPGVIAKAAQERATSILRDQNIAVEVLIVSRNEEVIAHHG